MQKPVLKQPYIAPDFMDLHQMLTTQIRKTGSQNLLLLNTRTLRLSDLRHWLYELVKNTAVYDKFIENVSYSFFYIEYRGRNGNLYHFLEKFQRVFV